MTRNVWVTVHSVQKDGGGNESRMESSAEGLFYEKNGSSYLLYEEASEEGGAVKNVVKCKGKLLELKRTGAVNARMVFEQGQTYMTDYATCFGMLRLGVKTRQLAFAAEGDMIRIQAEYELFSEGEPVSTCGIVIEAKSKMYVEA